MKISTAFPLIFALFAMTARADSFQSLPDGVSKKFVQRYRPAAHPGVAPVEKEVKHGGRRAQEDFTPGIWTSRGYGYTADARLEETDVVLYYEETSISCIVNPFVGYFVLDVELIENGSVASLDVGALQRYLFDFSEEFQSGCADGPTLLEGVDDGYVRDPVFIFEVLAQTFREHYAFFELRDLDWENMTSTAKDTLSANSTDEELSDAIVSVLGPLNDGHVYFATDDLFFESGPFHVFEILYNEFMAQLEAGDIEEEDADFDEYIEAQLTAWILTLYGYVDDSEISGAIGEYMWGTLYGGEVGYLNLITMAPEQEVLFQADMERAFADFVDCKVMIIDVRVNGGGYDGIGLGIASHFTDEPYVALSKKAVDGDNFTEATTVYVEPYVDAALRFDGPVIVLASESTVSAAEIFIMAMRENPKVTIMGRPTSGELSDVLQKTLPNFWEFSLSNEVYLTPDGELFEMVGIPPDVSTETDLLPLEDRQTYTDSWLDEALVLAGELIANMATDSETKAPTMAPAIAAPVQAPTTEAPVPTLAPSGSPTPDSDSAFSQGVNMFALSILLVAVGLQI